MESDDIDPALFIDILDTLRDVGASKEVRGKFALAFRRKIPVDMSASPVMEMGPVLEAFASDVVTKLQASGGLALASTAKGAKKTAVKDGSSKIIRLRVAGKQTSVSLAPALFDQAIKTFGTEAAAKDVVKQLARQVPDGVESRSGHMQELLKQAILTAAAGTEQASAARH